MNPAIRDPNGLYSLLPFILALVLSDRASSLSPFSFLAALHTSLTVQRCRSDLISPLCARPFSNLRPALFTPICPLSLFRIDLHTALLLHC